MGLVNTTKNTVYYSEYYACTTSVSGTTAQNMGQFIKIMEIEDGYIAIGKAGSAYNIYKLSTNGTIVKTIALGINSTADLMEDERGNIIVVSNSKVYTLNKSLDNALTKNSVSTYKYELDALKASQTQSQKDTTETNNAPTESKQFHVVIGSFPSQEMAENYAQSIESTTSIVNVSELNTYRVVLSMHNELNDALSALEEARKLTSKAWIAVQ